MTSQNNKVDTDSAEGPVKGVGCGAWLDSLHPGLAARVGACLKIELPVYRGVYALTLCGEIVYAGMTDNIMARIASHSSDTDKDFDGVLFWPVSGRTRSDLFDIEAHMIRTLEPRLNKWIPPDRMGDGKVIAQKFKRGPRMTFQERVEHARLTLSQSNKTMSRTAAEKGQPQ